MAQKKKLFETYSIASVKEDTFTKEKYPELEDPNYPAQLVQKAEAAAKSGKGEHASTPDPLRRQGHYQYRGPAYAHKKGGRNRYERWPMSYLLAGAAGPTRQAMLDKVEDLAAKRPVWAIVKDQAKWEARFKFPDGGSFPGPKKFFYLSARLTHRDHPEVYFFFTSGVPYPWTAHHLVPVEAFAAESEVHFSEEQQELIRASGYDLNNGHNIVPLPRGDVPPHCLLLHVGGHPGYIQRALRKLDALRDDIDAAKQSPAPHEAFYPQILKQMTKVEDELWSLLCELGEKSVKLFLQGRRPPKSDPVVFQGRTKSASTGTRRRFPEGRMA